MNKIKECEFVVLSYILLNYKKNGIKYQNITRRLKKEKFTIDDIDKAIDNLKRFFIIYEPRLNTIKLIPKVEKLKKE